METPEKAAEIVKALADVDPVDWGGGPKRRKCYLCERVSGENQENVNHTPTCPWIRARRYVGHKHLNADTGAVE